MDLVDANDRAGARLTPPSPPFQPLQPPAVLARRRALVIALNLALYAALDLWLASILSAGGWSALDVVFFACFLVASPWAVLGCVNACLGLWLLRFAPDGVADVAPYLAAGDADKPLEERVAVVMTVRNEDPARAIARLRRMADEIGATREAPQFSWHLLSDTSRDDIAAEEDRLIAAWRAERPEIAARAHYRRRFDNAGFKAGNLMEFATRCCDDYESMIVLDADSFMRAETLIRMARIAQAHPQIGILQSLAVGAPSQSAFARMFQFGMRAGMRSYTMGAAWWTADCGPFWGHNALVRLRPFVDHCKLPVLPGKPPFGGAILSHDQVEAVLMRRGGYEARVLPVESGSFEENPPDMVEFSVRDMRWCQGNMQYWKLLGMPGLKPVSRFQLVWAISMFLGLPASQALLAIATLKLYEGEPVSVFPVASATGFLIFYLLVGLAPKLAGWADVALGGDLRRYGGARLFFASALVELVASFLLSAAVGFRTARFLAGLPFGRSLGWSSQRRDAGALSWRDAARAFGPATAFGLIVLWLIAAISPRAVLYALPFAAGLALAIPFAKLTASPALGALFVRLRICAAPEEIEGR